MSTVPVDLILHDLADQLRKDPAPARAEMAELVQSCVNPLMLVEQVHRAGDDGAYLRNVLAGQRREPHKRQVEIAVAQRLAMHSFALLVEDLGAARRRAKDLLDIARRITGLDEQAWVTYETNMHGIHDATLQKRGESWRVIYNGAVMSTGDNMHIVSEAGKTAIEMRRTAKPTPPTLEIGDRVRFIMHNLPNELPSYGSEGSITNIDKTTLPIRVKWSNGLRTWHKPEHLVLVTPGHA